MSATSAPVSWLTIPQGTRPVGYAALILAHGLEVPPRRRVSFVAQKHVQRSERTLEERTLVTLPPQYDPGLGPCDQLEFALKHEGVDLLVLAKLFASAGEWVGGEIAAWVTRRPSSQYARRAWFLYEFLTHRELPLGSSTAKTYVPLLDPAAYHTGHPIPSQRHRVSDNLLGNADFCPIVRRTPALQAIAELRLGEEAAQLLAAYDAEVFLRAVDYLYTKETRSTFKLEGEVPDEGRAHRFVDVLRRMELPEALDEAEFTRLQNAIVSRGSEDSGYRQEPVYIGQRLDLSRQLIHFVAPRHEDVPALMRGLLACIQRMERSGVDPIVQAAVASFGFVFIHPFTDGNGRIHRALIHHILTRTGFTPKGFLLPVSAVILRQRAEYDAALESISKPLMRFVDYTEVEDGRIVIHNETAPLYRYLDFTRIAEDLSRWTEQTVRFELRQELDFIARYRKARGAIDELVDLPDRLINVFIQVVAKNGGHLSKAKRSLFSRLSDAQIEQMEQAVVEAFGDTLQKPEETGQD